MYALSLFVVQLDTEVLYPCAEGLGGYLKLFRGAALVAVVVLDSQFHFPLLVRFVVCVIMFLPRKPLMPRKLANFVALMAKFNAFEESKDCLLYTSDDADGIIAVVSISHALAKS